MNVDLGNACGSQADFSTTRWSLILLSSTPQSDEQKQQRALQQLCRTYWRPIFLYTFRRGFSVEDAQDLTQDFFTKILETDWLRNADRARGRFRSLLLKSLKNFLNDAHEKRTARKRGGGMQFVSWDDWMAEAPSQLSISAQTLEEMDPDRLYDLRWAATVVEQALRRLCEECQQRGRLRLYETLSPHLATDRADMSYAELASALGVEEAAVKRQLHNLRKRYRWLLRDEISRTVADPAEIDDEIRHLCAALAAQAER
ncbi:MAG: sigma-70 family RNA polymerase sigma factor [Verrucomicrobiota bacterium]|nr:sigma-70 family RNA polymerase sigma factor [Verrucomicrobiota bacterium]